MKRIWIIITLLLVCTGCMPQKADLQTSASDGTAATPVLAAAISTPEPELTTLEKAFLYTQDRLQDVPNLEDPMSVFPYSSRELLGSRQLHEIIPRDIEWAWREIAARRGISPYKAYDFGDRAWYEVDPNFKREELSQIEAMNIVNLRNTALEHYNNIKIIKNNRAQADLNGDGKQESFSFTADRFSNTGVLQIANIRYTIELPQLDDKIYLCDIDRSDAKLEIAIPYTRLGNDYRLAFYAWDGVDLILLGDVQGDRETIRLFGDGTLNAYSLDTTLCHWRYAQPFVLKDNSLQPLPMGLRTMLIKATLIKELVLTDIDGKTFALPSATTIYLMTITPQNECLVYDQASKQLGWFQLQDGTIDGTLPKDLMEGLPTLA